MDISDPDNNQFLYLAIQTVFYLNKDNINIHRDAASNDSFIKEMSSEILARAQRFKHITACMEELQ